MKCCHRFLITVLFISLFTNQAVAQKQFITGKVLNEAGKPVAYASITIKGADGGTRGGSQTLEDGTYRVELPQGYFAIVCEHLNYNSKGEKIEGNSIINFVLTRSAVRQSAIVVTGTHKYTATELKAKNKRQEVTGDESRIFYKVLADASFIGGEDALNRYLAKAIIYPDSATISDVKGIVKVGFIIGTDGLANNVTLIKGINKYTDELVIQAISKMPKWLPANQNGEKAEQYKEVAVSFDIKGIE